MKNGHSKDPDWGKFGLEDGEKQPLNPGSSAAEQAKPVNGEKGLFGGQVIDDNELFADDQVRYFEIFIVKIFFITSFEIGS